MPVPTTRVLLPATAIVLLTLGACASNPRPCPDSEPCRQPPQSAPVPSQPIKDTPNQHNMFMLGDKTLFVEHMPMFTKEDHMYQLILRVELPEKVMQAYRQVRASHPGKVPNLVNTQHDLLILPSVSSGDLGRFNVDVYADYDGATATPEELMFSSVPMTVRQVVRARHFDYSFNYPGELTYIMFGRDDEAHLSHYLSRNPDFQHLLTLPVIPSWISAEQLRAGVEINLVGMPGDQLHCSQPLTATSYTVRFQGWESPNQILELGSDATRWFSTANELNTHDPCGKSSAAAQGHGH